jgi:hypothetical protein
MVHEEPVHLVGRADRGKQRQADVPDRFIGYADARIVLQLLDARDVGVVGERVEGGPRQVEEERVNGLVDQNERFALEIVDRDVSRPQRRDGELPPAFPIVVVGKLAEYQADHVGVLQWKRIG